MSAVRPEPPAVARRIAPSRGSAAHSGSTLVVGIVGGVGSGKSTLVDAILERRHERRLDTLVIDGDTVGHEVRDQPETQARILKRFGGDLLDPDGQIDRGRLGERVFATDAQAALADLNAIMHPAMRAEFERRIEATAAPLTLFDAAILLEAGWDDLCDEILFVDVSDQTRLGRVAERGWGEQQWRMRETSQWPLDRKRAHATISIDAEQADPDDLAGAVLELLP